MKAADLQPGQFFEFEPTNERRLCIAQLDDGRCMFVVKRERNPDRKVVYIIDSCCQSIEVNADVTQSWVGEAEKAVATIAEYKQALKHQTQKYLEERGKVLDMVEHLKTFGDGVSWPFESSEFTPEHLDAILSQVEHDEYPKKQYKIWGKLAAYCVFFDTNGAFQIDLVSSGRHTITSFVKGTSRMVIEQFIFCLDIPLKTSALLAERIVYDNQPSGGE